MSLSASVLSPRTIVRPMLTFSVTLLALIVILPPLPAHAFETKAFGDVVVQRDETEPGVSTVIGDVRVDGFVARDVHSGFGDIQVNGKGVGGDINAGFGNVEVRGPVGGGIDAGFGDVYVDAPVRGDVDVGRGEVVLGPKGRVQGNVYYGSGVFQGNREAVTGTVATSDMRHDMEPEPGGLGIPNLVVWVFAAVAFAACSVLLAVLAPGPLLAATRRAEESPGWSLLFGVASVLMVLVLAVVLAVSIIGIPLLLLLGPAYLALLFFGVLVAAYFVGRRVVFATGRYRAGNALAALVGAIILAVAYLIPVLGGLLLYGLALFGTGASILALLPRRHAYPSYEAYLRDRRGA